LELTALGRAAEIGDESIGFQACALGTRRIERSLPGNARTQRSLSIGSTAWRFARGAGTRSIGAAAPPVRSVPVRSSAPGFAGEDAVAATAEWGSLTPAQVRAAVRYYAEYRDEVDARIRLNRQEAERRHLAWQRMHEALG